jgi:hypothetical protein
MDHRAKTILNKYILLDNTIELKDLESDGTKSSKQLVLIELRPPFLGALILEKFRNSFGVTGELNSLVVDRFCCVFSAVLHLDIGRC